MQDKTFKLASVKVENACKSILQLLSPKSIQPFWISREPIGSPCCNLASNHRGPYCASFIGHFSLGLSNQQQDATEWCCVLWPSPLRMICNFFFVCNLDITLRKPSEWLKWISGMIQCAKSIWNYITVSTNMATVHWKRFTFWKAFNKQEVGKRLQYCNERKSVTGREKITIRYADSMDCEEVLFIKGISNMCPAGHMFATVSSVWDSSRTIFLQPASEYFRG